MLEQPRRTRVLIAILVVVVATVLALPARAGTGGPPVLTGQVGACEDGAITITWTLEDILGPDYLFEITGTELSGAASGTVAFVPTTLDALGATAVGTTVIAGDTVGEVFLDVNFLVTFVPEQEQADDSSAAVVTLQGGCESEPVVDPGCEAFGINCPTTTSAASAGSSTRPSFTG
jgi:hypothetical protein